MRLKLLAVVTLGLLIARPAAQTRQTSAMDTMAERYVKLVLALGQHDADYVDAYYGPAEWKADVDRRKPPLAAIDRDAEQLLSELGRMNPVGEELVMLRHQYVRRQLEALRARVRMLMGAKLSFDEESRALYDAVAPTHPESYFQGIVNELEPLLPGDGALIARYDGFRKDFVIPPDRLDAVFDKAIEECRARTLKHVQLPPTESFTVEYVTNKSWSGYNWYQGNFRSLIQVNTDLPIYIDRAVDLACHEGYPGHHVYNALLEKHLVRDRGWQEYTVYALFSPQSLIAEGTANYGIDVAFPGVDRLEFERTVLFPLAGLNQARAAEYYKVQTLVERLAYAGNEAARRYLNGEIDRATAAAWLVQYALMSAPRAEQRVRFMDQYRSYVINYNLGKDLVKQHIDAIAGAGDRWQEFVKLLSSPRLPSGLRK
jgi:hypothetical protein